MNNRSPRPQLPPLRERERLQVTARQHQYLGALPTANLEVEGLIRGLATLNPALERFADQKIAEQREKATELSQARAQAVPNASAALRSGPAERPPVVPPALDALYQARFSEALAKRGAIEVRDELQARYDQQKDVEDFDVDQFLREGRQQALQGLDHQPSVVALIGEHFTAAESAIRQDANARRVRRHGEERLTTASALTGQFTEDMTPQQLAQHHFGWYVPQMRGIQVDPKQSASFFLNRVKTLSDAGGGRPDLFDAFSEKDSEGFTILDRNPQLQDEIASARSHAQRARDGALKEAKQPAVAKLLIGYDDDIRGTPERVTVDRLVGDVSSGNISAEKAASLYHQAQEELGKNMAQQDLELDAERGMLGYYDPKDQNKVLDKMLGATAKSMWSAATSGDSRQAQALASIIMERHSQTGATVPVDTLQRLMETTVTNLPAAEGPSDKFLASAEVYKALAADPKYRSMYFKGDSDEVMAGFVKHMAGGADAKTAYAAAYRAIDPSFKDLARKRAEAPQVQDKIRSIAVKYATGSTMWGWVGGNGRPENELMLGVWASTEVRRIMELNPDLSDKELHEHIERKAAENFVLDSTSQLAVKVPPSMSGDLTQKALTHYSKSFGDAMRAKGKFPDGSIMRYVPVNAEGLFEVQAWNGARASSLGQVSLQEVVNWHRAATTLSTEEGSQLAEVRKALRTGGAVPQVNPALMAKGRSVGFFKDNELVQAEKINREQVMARLRQVPDFGYGKPTNTASPYPINPNVKFDRNATSRVALEMAAAPVTARGFEHVGLAGSLIAMREGISLTAYPDPNPDAGMNIGAGYNLKANAATANQDLKRAGVPEGRIEDVKAGRASLTPDQAKRLLEVAAPRYEASARKSAEETSPGLWNRMTAQQRAVMVDIAYQVGDPAQFKKAWAALAAGKPQEFSDETRVFYRNKAGQVVEDNRARELRASMLAGVADWQARVSLMAR